MNLQEKMKARVVLSAQSVENTFMNRLKDRPKEAWGALCVMSCMLYFGWWMISGIQRKVMEIDTLNTMFVVLFLWFVFACAGFAIAKLSFEELFDGFSKESKLTKNHCVHALGLVEKYEEVKAFRDAIVVSGREIRYADYMVMLEIVENLEDEEKRRQEIIDSNACQKLHGLT